jgi:uncharacterized glyoxalase superfamily protein PhnB
VDTVTPHVVYHDVPAAIDWLEKTFGFAGHFRYGDPIGGAQIHLGEVYIMLSSTRDDRESPARLGRTLVVSPRLSKASKHGAESG